MVGEVISYPIDQVKTQCLTQGSSFLVAATTLARQRGVRGVFAGLPSPLVGAFFVKSTVFGAREFWKAALRRLEVGEAIVDRVRHGHRSGFRPFEGPRGLRLRYSLPESLCDQSSGAPGREPSAQMKEAG